jgi:hypothetical protein
MLLYCEARPIVTFYQLVLLVCITREKKSRICSKFRIFFLAGDELLNQDLNCHQTSHFSPARDAYIDPCSEIPSWNVGTSSGRPEKASSLVAGNQKTALGVTQSCLQWNIKMSQ